MHPDELPVDAGLVQRLIAEQLPAWAHLPIARVGPDAAGAAATVNAIFRLGDAMAARLPLRAGDPAAVEAELHAEAAALSELGEVIPFPVPQALALGRPGAGYPLPWAVQSWLPGVTATPDGLADSDAFADDLVALLRALRGAGTFGRSFTGSGRGGVLTDHDAWMAECFRRTRGLERSAGLPDVPALRARWAVLRELPPGGPDVMAHGDLHPGNLLVAGGRLAGVLDAGSFGAADPALDLVAAWHLLDRPARARLRTGLGSDDVEWARGAAWAFQQAMGLVWYYRRTNPGMSALGRSTLARIMTDPQLAGSDAG